MVRGSNADLRVHDLRHVVRNANDAWHCQRSHGTTAMNEHIKAWQCIGRGRIEAPQNCIGICQDRKVEFVYAFDYEDALAQLELSRGQVSALSALVRRLASTKPREHEWEHSYRALQEQARALLATLQDGLPPAEAELRDRARP